MSASQIFEDLRRFRVEPASGKTPQQSLIDYCKDELTEVEKTDFDYKTKEDPRVSKLSEIDTKNLAKAVSGFANGGGGVLIWGIKNKTLHPMPIQDVKDFLDAILVRGHNVTTPSVVGLDGDFIPADNMEKAGFALIYVPESDLPPHRVRLQEKETQNHYYVRSGSSFEKATHSQLEDMFGRRPRPDLVLLCEAGPYRDQQKREFTMILRNDGRGIAKYPYVTLRANRRHGISKFGIDGNGKSGLPVLWKGSNCGDDLFDSFAYGSQGGQVIHSGVSIGITIVHAVTMDPLIIEYEIAAEGLSLKAGKVTIQPNAICGWEEFSITYG